MTISGSIKPLKDKYGNHIFPETSSEAVYCSDGTNIEQKITQNISSINTDISNLKQMNTEFSSQLGQIDNKKANESDVKAISERMNQFTSLTQGSTTGDAELVDGRVGINGIIYSNIGGAIRNQSNNLLNSIELLNNCFENINGIFELGSLTNGNLVSVNYRIYSKNLISYDRDIVLIADDEYKFGIHTFNGETFLKDSGWRTIYNIPKNTSFKIVIAKRNEVTSEKADIDTFYKKVKLSTINGDKFSKLEQQSISIKENLTKNLTYLFNFTVGYLDSNGILDSSKRFRITTKDIMYTDKDIYFSKDSSIYTWIVFYEQNGTLKGNKELNQKLNKYIIPKNSYFRVQLAEFPLNSELSYSDIYESNLLNKITMLYEDINKENLLNEVTIKNIDNPYYLKDIKNKYLWTIAAFTGTDNELNIDYGRKDRVLTPFKCKNTNKLIMTINKGYYVWIQYYDNNNTFLYVDEMNTANGENYLIIQENSIFTLQVADSPLNTSTIYNDVNDSPLNAIKIEEIEDSIFRMQEEKSKLYSHNDLCKTLNWKIGYLDSQGFIDSNRKFRITSLPILAKEDLILKIDLGCFCWLNFKESFESVGFKKTVEVKGINNPSSYFIPKGSIYQLSLAKYPLDASIIHKKINELIEYCHIYTIKSEEEENKKYINRWDDTIACCCHRGLANIYPENTLVALKNCYKNGLMFWEIDVKKTKDNVLVVLHDTTINRTARNSDGSELGEDIYVSNLTYTELLNYDFGVYMGEQFKGEKIPTLEETLMLAKKLNCKLIVDGFIPSLATEIYNLVVKTGMVNNVIFADFGTDAYSKLLELNSSLSFCSSMSTLDYSKIDKLVELAGDKVNKCIMSISSNIITEELANYIHSKGLKLYIYVLDTPSAVLESLKYYPDGITTNACHTSRIIAEKTL